MCQDFFYQKVDQRWVIPVIQGYVEYAQTVFNEKNIELILISRRRHAMAGTRYNARGLDDDGSVANFVESEQIIVYQNLIMSYV